MHFQRVVDLSHVLYPGKEGRKLDIRMLNPEEVDDGLIRQDDLWYIMHDVALVTHIGTHIEAPYHCCKDGNDLAGMPVEQLVGEAVIIDLMDAEPGSIVPKRRIQDAAEAAGGIKKGDIVYGRLGYARYYKTPKYRECPAFATDGLQWLVDQGMKLFGVDSSGIELPNNPEQINHRTLLDRGIPYIENMVNLDKLTKNRVWTVLAPLAIKGLESFPLRILAFE